MFDDSSSNTGKNKENSGLLPSSTSANKKLYPLDGSGYVNNDNNNKNNNIIGKKLISSTNKGRMLEDDDGSCDTEATLAFGSFTLLSAQKRKDNNFIVDADSKSGSVASGEANYKIKELKTKQR